MNELERLNLQKMIKENDVVNTTDLMRDLKHSTKILEDVDLLLKIKREQPELAKSNPEQFDSICVEKCHFLFKHYTDLFNKVKKDEIDLNILLRLINVLHSIEEGELDQHTGSFEVGKLLKKIYIDSALRKADKLDEENKEQEESKPSIDISWANFKQKKD